MAVSPVPEGYQSVIPYLVIDGVAGLIEFLKTTFAAVEIERVPGPDGKVMHAEVRIGDSVVMMGDACGTTGPSPATLHVYLPDVDAAYQRALNAGATSIEAPTDKFYGDRSAGVADAWGNRWFMATHVEDVSSEEMQRRAAAYQKSS